MLLAEVCNVYHTSKRLLAPEKAVPRWLPVHAFCHKSISPGYANEMSYYIQVLPYVSLCSCSLFVLIKFIHYSKGRPTRNLLKYTRMWIGKS